MGEAVRLDGLKRPCLKKPLVQPSDHPNPMLAKWRSQGVDYTVTGGGYLLNLWAGSVVLLATLLWQIALGLFQACAGKSGRDRGSWLELELDWRPGASQSKAMVTQIFNFSVFRSAENSRRLANRNL